MDTAWLWVACLALAAGFAALTAKIAREKGHSPLAYGLLGLCFPVAGLMVALLQPDRSVDHSGPVVVPAPARPARQDVDAAEHARA